MAENLTMTLLKETLGVCRLSRDTQIPLWAVSGEFLSITRTYDELSLVCGEDMIPEGITCEKGWRALKVEGPLDFSLIGILSRISSVLAEAGISIFALSTFDTDYILIKKENLHRAVEALESGGYCIRR